MREIVEFKEVQTILQNKKIHTEEEEEKEEVDEGYKGEEEKEEVDEG